MEILENMAFFLGTGLVLTALSFGVAFNDWKQHQATGLQKKSAQLYFGLGLVFLAIVVVLAIYE
jgi:hypothetical protein